MEILEDRIPSGRPAPPGGRTAGRTTAVFIAVAAVLGTAVGTAAGYTVQAGREPAPLPALSAPGLAYPAPSAGAGSRPMLSAAEDRRVTTDGDLTRLLLPKPAKTSDGAALTMRDGWMPPWEYAERFADPPSVLNGLLSNGVRRIAHRSWVDPDGRFVEVSLLQFRQHLGATAYTSGYREELNSWNDGHPLRGTGDGKYYVMTPDQWSDEYSASAVAYRGDIAVHIEVGDSAAIPVELIRDLAERQLERL
ncbi:hypothetical protein [Streptomyces sp. NPDC058953]|uniref:hypothetical protein n=1 Tax=unclassified Streptomyces TaxID=2593676 RepID=UPI0036AA46BD